MTRMRTLTGFTYNARIREHIIPQNRMRTVKSRAEEGISGVRKG